MQNNIIQKWRIILANKQFRYSLFGVILLLIVQMSFISYFQAKVELRDGVVFNDPIMHHFPAIPLDIPIFIAIYSANFLAIYLAFKKPEIFLHIAIGYLLVYFFRILSIFLLPLNPPTDIIILKDPILYWFGGGDITKDLFYSGHTSSVFMGFLITENKKAKIFIGIALIVTILGILLQKVHYSIDVYAALFFTYTAYRIALFTKNKILKNVSTK